MSARPTTIQKRTIWNHLLGTKQQGRCCFCLQKFDRHQLTLEHIQPLSLGGTNAIPNFDMSCTICNNERGVQDFAGFRQQKWFGSVGSNAQF